MNLSNGQRWEGFVEIPPPTVPEAGVVIGNIGFGPDRSCVLTFAASPSGTM